MQVLNKRYLVIAGLLFVSFLGGALVMALFSDTGGYVSYKVEVFEPGEPTVVPFYLDLGTLTPDGLEYQAQTSFVFDTSQTSLDPSQGTTYSFSLVNYETLRNTFKSFFMTLSFDPAVADDITIGFDEYTAVTCGQAVLGPDEYTVNVDITYSVLTNAESTEQVNMSILQVTEGDCS